MPFFVDKHRLLRIACLLWLFCLTGLAGCGKPPEPPLSPQAQAFAKNIKQDINQFVSPLIEPTAKQDVKKLSNTLSSLFQEAAQRGRPLAYSLYVLDNQARLLTGHYYQPGKPDGVPDKEITDQDYSKFKIISEIKQKPKMIQSRFYMPQKVYYVIFVPLEKNGKVVGILLLVFAAPVLQDQFKLSEKDFMAIDFNR